MNLHEGPKPEVGVAKTKTCSGLRLAEERDTGREGS